MAWMNHPVHNQVLLISMHLQADVCGALIGSFLAFFLTPNPELHNNSTENQTMFFFMCVYNTNLLPITQISTDHNPK